MTTYAAKTCEELKEALATARGAIESPRMHTDTDMNYALEDEASPIGPAATQPDLLKEIEEIQQAMREAGCA